MTLTGTFSGSGDAPSVLSARALSPTQVRIDFSEAMAAATLASPSNFSLSAGLGSTARTVTRVLLPDSTTPTFVILTLSGVLTEGTANYTITVDTSATDAAGNAIDTSHRSAIIDGPPATTTTVAGTTSSRDRYRDLILSLPYPDGEVFKATGEIVPHRNDAHTFTIQSAEGGVRHDIAIGDTYIGEVDAAADGLLTFTSPLSLEAGDYTLQATSRQSGATYTSHVSIRRLASITQVVADSLETHDAALDDMEAARALSTVTSTYADAVYGAQVRQGNPSYDDGVTSVVYSLPAYRDMLRALRAAYRHFGGHPVGLREAVEAFTSSSPFKVPKTWRGKWAPSHNLIENGGLQARSRTCTALYVEPEDVDGLPNLNSGATTDVKFVRLLALNSYCNLGSNVLDSPSEPYLRWNGGPSIDVSSGGAFTLRGPDTTASLCGRTTAATSNGQTISTRLGGVGNYAPNYHDILYVTTSVGGQQKTQPLSLASISLDDIKSELNVRVSGQTAAVVQGSEGTNTYFLKLLSSDTGPAAKIQICPGPADASVALGLCHPATQALTAAISGSTVTVATTSTFPSITSTEDHFKIRLRGLRKASSGVDDGVISGSGSHARATFSSVSYTFTAADVGGWVRITGAVNAANLGIHRIASVSGGNATIEQPSGIPYANENSLRFAVYGHGELATVTAIASSTTLTLSTAPGYAWPAGAIIEMADTINEAQGSYGLDEVTVNVDTSVAVWGASDTLTVEGSHLPDEVLAASASLSDLEGASRLGVTGLLSASRLLAKRTGADLTLDFAFKDYANFIGQYMRLTVWARDHGSSSSNGTTLSVSFDAGATFESLGTYTLGVTPLHLASTYGPLETTKLTAGFVVPHNAEGCIIRLTRTGGSTISVEKALLNLYNASASTLGHGTTPRSGKVSAFGELLYVWSPAALSPAEEASLGLPEDLTTSSVASPGHIDYLTPAHGYWERFNLSEYDGSDPINIVGAYDAATLSALSAINMASVERAPTKQSYLVPAETSLISGEVLALDMNRQAQLSELSTHAGSFPQTPATRDLLIEVVGAERVVNTPQGPRTLFVGDEVPVPATLDAAGVQPWQFIAEDQVELASAYFVATSTYKVSYERLIQVTSDVIDLTSGGASYEEYLWLVDAPHWTRRPVTVGTQSVVNELLDVLGDGSATPKHQVDTRYAITITRDDGVASQTLSSMDWTLSNNTFKLKQRALLIGSVYYINYTARVPVIEAACSVSVEWRSSETESDLTDNVVEWQPVTTNYIAASYVVPTSFSHRYHQVRVTLTGINYTDDVRIAGLGMKGIHVGGGSPVAPGIV